MRFRAKDIDTGAWHIAEEGGITLEDVRRIQFGPNDLLFIKVPQDLPTEMTEFMCVWFRENLPDVKVLVSQYDFEPTVVDADA